MSHPEGAYLGGVRDVETLRQRCRINPDTGCWHWGLAFSQGQPRVHYVAPDTGKRMTQRGRRAAAHLSSGRELAPGIFAFARINCKADDCVNPGHTRTGTRAQMAETMRRAGRTAPSPVKRAAMLRMVRTRPRTKLTMEKAREIRASDKSSAELAIEYDIARSQIDAIKAGTAWREMFQTASIFAMAPQRTPRTTNHAEAA